jgi:hypothetical protein
MSKGEQTNPNWDDLTTEEVKRLDEKNVGKLFYRFRFKTDPSEKECIDFSVFERECITGDVFLTLSKEDLIDLGIPMGVRKKFFNYLENVQRNDVASKSNLTKTDTKEEHTEIEEMSDKLMKFSDKNLNDNDKISVEEAKKYLKFSDVKKLYIKLKAQEGCNFFLYNFQDPKKGKPVAFNCTEQCMTDISNGKSLPLDTKAKPFMYKFYDTLLFSLWDLEPKLSLKIAKEMLLLLFKSTSVACNFGRIIFSMEYGSWNCGNRILTAENPFFFFGWADVKSSVHVLVPKNKVNGSRFASCVLGVMVRDEPHIAILYIGSLNEAYYSKDSDGKWEAYSSIVIPVKAGVTTTVKYASDSSQIQNGTSHDLKITPIE